jgi:hypothetical protein
MAWTKGKSGNPAGRPPSEKAFADLLRIAIKEPNAEGVPKLRSIVDQLVNAALDGESWAMQMIADRLDGKPAQESTVTIDDKRDATDWTRAELVEVLNHARNGGDRTDTADGRSGEPDSVH